MLVSPRPSFKSGIERSLSLTEAVVQTPTPNPECCDQHCYAKISLSLRTSVKRVDGVCVKVVFCIFLVLRAMGGVSLNERFEKQTLGPLLSMLVVIMNVMAIVSSSFLRTYSL